MSSHRGGGYRGGRRGGGAGGYRGGHSYNNRGYGDYKSNDSTSTKPAHDMPSFTPVGGVIGALTRLAEGTIPIGGVEAPKIPTGSISLTAPVDIVLQEIADSMAKDLEQQYQVYTGAIIRCAAALPHKAMLYASLVALVTQHNSSFSSTFLKTLKQGIVSDLKEIHFINFSIWPDNAESIALQHTESSAVTSRLPRLAGVGADSASSQSPALSAFAKEKIPQGSSAASPSAALFSLKGQLRLLAALGSLRVVDPVSVLTFFVAILKIACVSFEDLESFAAACLSLSESVEKGGDESVQDASPVVFMPKALAVPPPGLRSLKPDTVDSEVEPLYVFLPYADAIVHAVLAALPFIGPDVCPNENDLQRLVKTYESAISDAQKAREAALSSSSMTVNSDQDSAALAIASAERHVARPVFCTEESFALEDDARATMYRLVMQKIVASIQTYLLIRAELRSTEPGRALGNPLCSFWQDPAGFVKRRTQKTEEGRMVEEALLTDEDDEQGWATLKPWGPMDALEESFDAVTGRVVFSRSDKMSSTSGNAAGVLLSSMKDIDEENLPMSAVPCAILAPSVELFSQLKASSVQRGSPVTIKFESDLDKELRPPTYAGSYVASTEVIAPPITAAASSSSTSAPSNMSAAAAAASITTEEEMKFMSSAFSRVPPSTLALLPSAKKAFPDLTRSLVLVGTPLLFRPRLGVLLDDESEEEDGPTRIDKWLTSEYAADILLSLDGLQVDRVRALATLPPLAPQPGTGILVTQNQAASGPRAICPAVGRFNADALTYVFREAISFILHPVNAFEGSSLALEVASVAYAVRGLFADFLQDSAPRLGPALNLLFTHAALLSPAARARLTFWFAGHISASGLQWPWRAWSHVCALPKPSTDLSEFELEQQLLRRLSRHPGRMFIADTFERCCSLLFWQKVVYFLRQNGSDEEVQVFLDLCPPPPEPCDLIGQIILKQVDKWSGSDDTSSSTGEVKQSEEEQVKAEDKDNSMSVTSSITGTKFLPFLPEAVHTAMGEFNRLTCIFESLLTQPKTTDLELQAWIDDSLIDCARVASALKQDPRVHPALRIAVHAVLRCGARSYQHAETMLSRCAHVLIKLVQVSSSPSVEAIQAAKDLGFISPSEPSSSSPSEGSSEGSTSSSSPCSLAEAVVLESIVLYWKNIACNTTTAVTIERFMRYGVVKVNAGLSWMAEDMFALLSPLPAKQQKILTTEKAKQQSSPLLGVFSNAIWASIERVLALVLQSLASTRSQIKGVSQYLSTEASSASNEQPLTGKIEVRTQRVYAKNQETLMTKAYILSDVLRALGRTAHVQGDVASSIRVRQGITALLGRFAKDYAEVYFYLDAQLRHEYPELQWTMHI